MVQNNAASFVIAISGPAGSGKSSLVQKVTSLLDDAVSFYFDDYESVSKYPSDFLSGSEKAPIRINGKLRNWSKTYIHCGMVKPFLCPTIEECSRQLGSL